ncbi:phage tail protein [Methylobacterium tarhaniae]|uniref:phage tail protein n=1 Tax=Methylobacterium tarhaniae TaxID=1187852 RepID=UPI0012EE0437|nr:tail fiber protein [Methylobacterium tarhaniae]
MIAAKPLQSAVWLPPLLHLPLERMTMPSITKTMKSVLLASATSTPILASLCLPSIADQPTIFYVGEIKTLASPACPANFLPAAGQVVNISDYPNLFAAIGGAFGGDGRATFGIPDLRKRAAIGTAADMPLATATGASSVTLTADQVPLVSHDHAATFAPVTGNVMVTIPATPGTLTVTPQLLVKKKAGGVNVQDGSFLSQGGVGQSSAPIYLPSSDTADTAKLGGLSAEVAGLAATAANSIQVPTVTGGTVTVAPKASDAQAPVSIQSPALAMTVCIAVNGLLPTSH